MKQLKFTKQNSSDAVGEHLAAATQGKPDAAKVLEFDPESGELVVRERTAPINPDATAVDQIATDGFAGLR